VSLPSAPNSAPEILKHHAEATTAYLRHFLERYHAAPPRLLEAISYSLLAGGKRLRPALLLETFHACAGSADAEASALAAAGAVELIHTFSLVHDDLPAMDDDDFRRGVPTNHKVFGEALAILAGDAMVTMAFELLATDLPSHLAAAMVKELASASGPEGMIGGQVLDMDSSRVRTADRRDESPDPQQLEQLQNLHRKKTGALLRSACRLGAMAASANAGQLAAVTEYGEHLGLAFQIVDDLLDVTASKEQIGKATGKDAEKGKITYPMLIGVEGSRREAERQQALALAAIEPLGDRAEGLRMLARFVGERTS
jgi:geranylgeranyl diphosphate synthase type II